MVAAGIGIGLFGAVTAANGISSLLYDLDPFDPLIFAVAATGVAAVAAVSIFIPAERISRLDPMTAIRSERS